MESKKKTFIGKSSILCLSVLVIIAVAALAIGVSYALFSDEAKGNVHLSAGTLDIGFYRVGFTQYTLNENGTMAIQPKNTERVDLTTDNGKVFDIQGSVPTSWYQADFELSNNGAVAADCTAKILWNRAEASENEKIFAEQLKITVTVGKEVKTFMLASDEAQAVIDLGAIFANTVSEGFSVKVEFVDDENNNAVKNANISFDIQVTAVQKVA